MTGSHILLTGYHTHKLGICTGMGSVATDTHSLYVYALHLSTHTPTVAPDGVDISILFY